MKKHATSHGLAVIVCTISAGILVKIAKDYYPAVVDMGENLVLRLAHRFGWNMPSRDLIVLVVATVLALFWGVAFSFMHSDEKLD